MSDLLELEVARAGHVLTLTLNRPAAMNALNRGLMTALREALAAAEHDDAIRAIVLTGSGDRAFCAGIDLRERRGLSDLETRQLRHHLLFPLFRDLHLLSKPLIAAVNGVAAGGGLELAACADLRLAAPAASFRLSEVTWGIVPSAGVLQRLVAIVGLAWTKEMALTARVVDAEEARQLGLVTHLVDAAELLDRAQALASLVASHAPIAIRQTKKALDRSSISDLALTLDAEAAEICLTTEDYREALAAFAEKRPPRFQGR